MKWVLSKPLYSHAYHGSMYSRWGLYGPMEANGFGGGAEKALLFLYMNHRYNFNTETII